MRPALAAFATMFTPAPLPAHPAIQIEGEAVQGGLVRGRVPAGTTALSLAGMPVSVAADGRFVLGFDRDHPADARLAARLADGSWIERRIAIAPRSWRIERIDVARRSPGLPDEAYRLRREAELARIGAARTSRSAVEGWRQTLLWPAHGRISGRFGSQRIYHGVAAAYHSGVDLAAGAGAPVVAPADGIVVLAGPPAFSLEGNLVIIDHGFGLNSAFLHLASSRVSVGQAVRRGQLVGTVGATGRATGPHLHWSLMWNGARLDPELAAGAAGGAAE
ncbi:MAG TPA: M23 family metallopeptidase [Allosphingosinicella sp.]|nr:M23 family metallopeptidase [Allosphingosinicella sp.]